MEAAFDFLRSYPAIPIVGLLICGVAVWHSWQFTLRPLLIPKGELDAVGRLRGPVLMARTKKNPPLRVLLNGRDAGLVSRVLTRSASRSTLRTLIDATRPGTMRLASAQFLNDARKFLPLFAICDGRLRTCLPSAR